MSNIDSLIKSKFLKTHLDYVDQTEPPKLMHIWSAITAAGAAMGRHCYVNMGFKKTYANNFCLLVGPPGTRKNTAINLATNLMSQSTNVKFAPDDTGGMRQGLIAAIKNSDANRDVRNSSDLFSPDGAFNLDIEALGNMNLSIGENHPDKHALFIKATEFGSFLGQGSVDMTRFLIKMWDCESYTYTLKKEDTILQDPLLNLLGGTTSSDLSSLLPIEAIGQGFMSRIILVFAPRKEKSVPPSKVSLKTQHEPYLKSVYKFLNQELKGEIAKSKGAQDLEDELYELNIQLQDSRFLHYSARRGDHLMKTAMIIAGADFKTEISEAHYEEANLILSETELYMSDALGEYGLSPLAVARQKMLEFIQHANGPVTSEILWLTMRKDMRLVEFRNSLSELINANKISEVSTVHGQAFIYTDASEKKILRTDSSDYEIDLFKEE